MILLKACLLLLIGLAGGLVVGAGTVAFLTVLGIVPRLAQITKTHSFIKVYQGAIILGSVFWTWTGLRGVSFDLPSMLTLVHGIFAGIFVGMLAAALTEVLNVLPILAKRIQMVEQIIWLLMAMVFGKILGSLFHWIYFSSFS